MTVTKERKAELISQFGGSDQNTGSADVQVALLSERINDLTEHMRRHKKDVHSRLGLLKLVSQRAKLLKYLHGRDPEHYRALSDKLGLRRKY